MQSMIDRTHKFLAPITICLALLLSTVVTADVTTETAGWADGNSTGTVTDVSYGENGIESVEFTTNSGKVYTISDGDFNDIREFGKVLEKAYDGQDIVTLQVEMGDLKKVSRSRPEPKPEPKPETRDAQEN